MDSAEEKPLKIGIVGAGIGGLCFAKALFHLKANVSCHIFERSNTLKARGGSLGMAQGKWVIKRLGLSSEFDAIANHPLKQKYHYNGELFLEVETEIYKTVMRRDLHKLLFDSLPEGVVSFGRTVTAVEEHPAGVSLTFANNVEEEFDMVIAADGIHSTVKSNVFEPVKPKFEGFRVLYLICNAPVRTHAEDANVNWYEVDGKGYHIMDWTSSKGDQRRDVCMCVCRSEKALTDEWETAATESKVLQFIRDVAPDNQMARAMADSMDECFEWGIYSQPQLPSWVSKGGKVVLMGDAAHATAPFLGQGANMALVDAWHLAKLLAQPLPAPAARPGAASLDSSQGQRQLFVAQAGRAFEAARKAPCEAIMKSSSAFGALITASGWRARLRNWYWPFVVRKRMAQFDLDPTVPRPAPVDSRPASGFRRFIKVFNLSLVALAFGLYYFDAKLPLR